MDASFHIKQPQKRIIVPGILYQEQYAVLQNVTFKLLLVRRIRIIFMVIVWYGG